MTLAIVGAALAGFVTRAGATYISSDERIEAQAEVSAQGTAQHNDARNIEWVQERNEIKLGLRYFLFPTSKEMFGLHRPRINILYRARFDPVYMVRDKYDKHGLNRDDFKFPEGEYPREMFFDTGFQHPLDWLSLRIGRQQVVWGEADLFRSLDVINPLRLDQNGLIGERFDDYREPLLIAKFLASVGELGPLSNVAIEGFFSPNSQPLTDHIIVGEAFRLPVSENICLTNPVTGATEGPNRNFKCLRPNALPFSRVRHPWEVSRVSGYPTDAANFADVGSLPGCHDGLGLQGGCGDFVYGINDGWTRKWLSLDYSMAGIRLFGQTFGGIDFSLDYIFKHTEVPGTSLSVGDLFDRHISETGAPNPQLPLLAQAVAAMATLDRDGNGFPDGVDQQVRDCLNKKPQLILASLHGATPQSGNGALGGNVNQFTGCEKTGFWYPWTHILGVTGTYNDNRYTGFIWRLEESYSTREPRTNHPPLAADRAGQFPVTDDFDSHLKRQTGVWRSMIGFDYLRTIWPTPPSWIRRQIWATLLTDQWFFTFQFFNEYYSHVGHQIGLLDSTTDRQQQWNPILTYVMTGFFAHDKLRPFIAAGYDINANFPVTWVQFEYFVTPKLSIKIGDIEYLGSSRAESFLFLNKYADRDTAFLKMTYFLL